MSREWEERDAAGWQFTRWQRLQLRALNWFDAITWALWRRRAAERKIAAMTEGSGK